MRPHLLTASLALIAGSAQAQSVRLKYATFDPLAEVPPVPPALAAAPADHLFLIQFTSTPTEAMRGRLRALGATIERFLTDDTHVVRLNPAALPHAGKLPFVRWAGPFHPAYRLCDEARAHILLGGPPARYSIQAMRSSQQPALADAALALGAVLDRAIPGESRIEATLTADQLLALTRRDDVNYVDAADGAPGHDMVIVRQIGGATALASLGFSGQGVRAEVLDLGINLAHAALQNPPPLLHGPLGPGITGTSTYGIIFANWPGMPDLTGLLPDREQGIFGDASAPLSLLQRLHELTDAQGPYRGVLLSSSVGSAQVTQYSTISSDTDNAIFLTDTLMTQSWGNTGLAGMARPQALAKNIISVGGIIHQNTLTRDDDTAGGALGPASDGRTKPDLAHFYDNVDTIGGATNTATLTLGGTSASSPITAGYFGLIVQLWHEGVFPGFGRGPSVFDDRPHQSTARALAINSAFRYDWLHGGPNASITRAVQGWGMIDAGRLYAMRNSALIVNESDILAQGQATTYSVTVHAGAPALTATLVFTDPPGNPAAAQSRINDLSLSVTAPDGTLYWGNHGLTASNASTPGGTPDTINTVENIIIPTPAPGQWSVRIVASEIVEDAYLPDPEINAAYALVVSGIVGPCYANCDRSTSPPVLNVNDFVCFLNAFASGDPYANCDGSTTPPVLNILDFSCFLNAFAAGCP